MSTKYVLCGGAAHIPDTRNDLFFSEVLKNTAVNVKILLVLFAKEGDKLVENSKEDISQFMRIKGNKRFEFKVADKDKFLEQIPWADVIFVHGGSPDVQLSIFLTYGKEKLQKLFDGKTIAGDSAGVYFIAEYVYSVFKKRVFRGIGLLPIKLICHYSEGDEENLKELPSDLEQVTLKEYEYRVISA